MLLKRSSWLAGAATGTPGHDWQGSGVGGKPTYGVQACLHERLVLLHPGTYEPSHEISQPKGDVSRQRWGRSRHGNR